MGAEKEKIKGETQRLAERMVRDAEEKRTKILNEIGNAGKGGRKA